MTRSFRANKKKTKKGEIRQRIETRRRGNEREAIDHLERHESDGALPCAPAGAATRHPDQPDAAAARGLGGGMRLRRDAAPDLRVGEHAAADREPARAPPLADVGPLVQHPGHRRRLPRRVRVLLRRRQGAVAGREPAAAAARGRPLPGEAAERVHLPRAHRGAALPLVSLPPYAPTGRPPARSPPARGPSLTRPPFGLLLGLLYSSGGFGPAWVGEWSEEDGTWTRSRR